MPGTQSTLSATYDAYLIGPGDALEVELQDIPEYSGVFSIGPDGTMYVPRLRGLYVEGLTVEELRYFLTQQFATYVRNPQVFVRPVAYRPIRVYVGGEVRRPGYYYLAGEQTLDDSGQAGANSASLTSATASRSTALANPAALRPQVSARAIRLPTVFDAIRAGQGVTPFSDLASVSVTRRQPLSAGGGKIRTDPAGGRDQPVARADRGVRQRPGQKHDDHRRPGSWCRAIAPGLEPQPGDRRRRRTAAAARQRRVSALQPRRQHRPASVWL